MALIKELDYKVPKINAAQMAMQRMGSTRAGAWFFARTMHHIDSVLLRLSRGQVTLAPIVAGVAIVTVTTTGARTRLRRETHIAGVPSGGDIAIIGTSFGRSRTPGWYYNMRADPKVEVTYRNKTVSAIAREASAEERRAIWARARTIYAGYEAYARRIKSREIPIMILSSSELQ
jgi:deazaflavin-dependent oxidoreductase (nitroreductase family)